MNKKHFLLFGLILVLALLLFWFSKLTPLNVSVSTIIPSPSPSPQNIQLLFGGDMMFDRHIRKNSQKNSYDFVLEDLTPLFKKQDLVIANLEGPITDNNSVSLGSEIGSTNNYIFTFSPDILSTLKKNNITAVNIGNNHIMNFGEKGLESTTKYLTDSQFNYFGDTGNSKNPKRFIILEIKGKKIALVNYNQFVSLGLESCLEDIELSSKEADIIIVYAHWGNEYISESNQTIKQLAHKFIDAGADLIIGSHPHVVQQTESYQGKTIYYSLGNFVFDQYFMEETKQGLLVEVSIENSTNEITFIDHAISLLPNSKTTYLKTNKQ